MLKKIIFILLVFSLLLLIWEFLSRTSSHLLFILPPPSHILSTCLESYDKLLFHSYVTFKEMAAGFILALIFAFPLAWIMLHFTFSRLLLQPFFILIQCLPMFTLAPLMIIWFGWSFISIVIPTALMIFFPLTLNIYQGIRSTPSSLLDFFKVNGASKWRTFFSLRLPWAVPYIFSGLRISSAIAGIGAIAGEWAGAQEGLGVLMIESRRNVDLEMAFAALTLLTLLSFAFYAFMLLLEKAFSCYRQKIATYVKFLSLFLLIFSLNSCSKNHQQKTRLLLDWLPNPNHIPLYVGLKKGYFQEEGINLIIQKMPDSGAGISFLTSGQTDLMIDYLPEVMKAASRGAKIKIVGLLIKEPLRALIFRKSDIFQPSDLSGKILGFCLGGPDMTFLNCILKQRHIEPSLKLNVGMDLLSMLATEKVDFIYGGFWNIEPFQWKSLGIETEYFKLSEFSIPDYYELIVIANANSYESHPNFVKAFQKALQKSIDDCKANPLEAFAIYQHLQKNKRSKTIVWEKEAWAITCPLLASNQNVDPDLISSFYHFLLENQILKSSFSQEDLIP